MASHTARARNLDSKGRLTLGERFANRTVLVEQVDEHVLLVTLARVVPEREAWLYRNARAKASVKKGLRQARAKRFSKKPPDISGDEALARKLAD